MNIQFKYKYGNVLYLKELGIMNQKTNMNIVLENLYFQKNVVRYD